VVCRVRHEALRVDANQHISTMLPNMLNPAIEQYRASARISSCGPSGRRLNDSPLPSPIVAVTLKKSHTRLGRLMLYRILHWLLVLSGSLTIVPSTIRIVRLIASSSRYATFSRSNSIDNKRSPSSLLRRRLSKATSEMSAQVAAGRAPPSPAKCNPAPHAGVAYATARQEMETHAIARPHATATPFAAILRETTTRASSLL